VFLKSLKVVGFKSFADRTRLEFEPGVTVVVGPNGAGKSNLVDALAWVMGTQSTRTLRTQKMEDVIFAGTATRPALSRAEVTLVFDNASRLLPLDLDEVSVTRRLYRDGSSDYQINGVDCRLLDVQELLSDSGIGRYQHVIVGQGQLDSILNAKPEDHRAVIEEAAGILKHRLRKERAVRRLERTDADVLRLRDILQELKRQMRPLRRQAQAAERSARSAAVSRGRRTAQDP
jgi:chromosome segregation protein